MLGGIEALPFGVLIFVAGTLLFATMWGVVDTKFAADAAAREGARFAVENAGAGTAVGDLIGRTRSVATDTFREHGRAAPPTVVVDAGGGGRCARVTVTVAHRTPAVRIPFVGAYGSGFTVTSTHSEIVDPNRSGVAGEATCLG